MKTITKVLLLLIIILSLSSCKERALNNPINPIPDENNYTIKIIDGCEYLERYRSYQNDYVFLHKGDCKNPIHYQTIHDTICITTHDTIYIKNNHE